MKFCLPADLSGVALAKTEVFTKADLLVGFMVVSFLWVVFVKLCLTHELPDRLDTAGGPSQQLIPNTPATAVLVEVALFYQRSEVLLQGVATRAGQPDEVAHRDPAVLACELDDLQR